MSSFDINKYVGKWYELVHYPSWFQRNDNYNTTAEYSIDNDGSVTIHNSTITQGKLVQSYGIAKQLSIGNFRVNFAPSEIKNVVDTGQFQSYQQGININEPNYVIDKVWLDINNNYIFAVVTDAEYKSLYLLSRSPKPNLSDYSILMNYIIEHYDRDRLVQTPHYL